MKKRALISVSNKDGIVEFAQGIAALDFEIISTGGTLRALKEAGIHAVPVEAITGFPEILNGRVKTLHPAIHGGLLAKRDESSHLIQLTELDIQFIDLVVVNLYPFKQTLLREGVTKEAIIENIDIGGPTLLRAAAKNNTDVTVVVDPADYSTVLDGLRTNTWDTAKRKQLAAKVFRHTAHYDAMIAQFFTKEVEEDFPNTYSLTYEKVETLRYGENPHQKAAFYKTPVEMPMSLANAVQLHGKKLSFNNIQDANACLEIIAEFHKPAAVVVKHMNPCGIGVGETGEAAFVKAYEADPVSIFGGIVAINREINQSIAKKLSQLFLEIVIAPCFTKEALEILEQKKNIRLLTLEMQQMPSFYKIIGINGGLLVQSNDQKHFDVEQLEYPTKRKPTDDELQDLLFAWKAVKHVKSNAIVLAKNGQTIGIGAGQMNRVGAAGIAIHQAGTQAQGSVMASDAFFPMSDTVEVAAKAGIKAIIQPGGSKRDQESIDMCNQHAIAMVFTGVRHFKH